MTGFRHRARHGADTRSTGWSSSSVSRGRSFGSNSSAPTGVTIGSTSRIC